MIRIVFSALCVVVWCLESSVAQTRGVSYIGACHTAVSAKDLKEIFADASTVRLHILLQTFNANGCPAVEGFIKDARPMELHISLLNGPGLRNRRLQPHEYLYGYTIKSAQQALKNNERKAVDDVKRAAQAAAKLIAARGTRPTIVRVKTCLECDFDKATRERLEQIARPFLANVEFIDNPLRDSCLKGRPCEKHGQKARTEFQDLDGEDYDTIEQLKWTEQGTKTRGQHIWKLCNNGFRKDEAWIPPLKRKNFCGRRDIEEFRFWVRDDALAVQSAVDKKDTRTCKRTADGFDGVKKGYVWKLGDGRTDAVVLLPLKDNRQTNYTSVILMKNGKRIDSAFSRGRYKHDPVNQQRQIFQFSKHTVSYPDNVVMHVNGGEVCYILERPQFRID